LRRKKPTKPTSPSLPIDPSPLKRTEDSQKSLITCKANEEYLNCGSPCAGSCSSPPRKFCQSKQCIEGCFCKKGFIKHYDVCITIEKCPGNL